MRRSYALAAALFGVHMRAYASAQEAESKALERLLCDSRALCWASCGQGGLSELARNENRAVPARSDPIVVVRVHNKELWIFPDRMDCAALPGCAAADGFRTIPGGLRLAPGRPGAADQSRYGADQALVEVADGRSSTF